MSQAFGLKGSGGISFPQRVQGKMRVVTSPSRAQPRNHAPSGRLVVWGASPVTYFLPFLAGLATRLSTVPNDESVGYFLSPGRAGTTASNVCRMALITKPRRV